MPAGTPQPNVGGELLDKDLQPDPELDDDLDDDTPDSDPAAEPEPEVADPLDLDEAERAKWEATVDERAKKAIAETKGDPLELARKWAKASHVVGRQGNDLGTARKERDMYRKAFEDAGGYFDGQGNPVLPSKAAPTAPAAPTPTVDPQTGFHVDPASGRRTDPKTGNYVAPALAGDGSTYDQLYDRYGVEILDEATLSAIEADPRYGVAGRMKVERMLDQKRNDARLREIEERSSRAAMAGQLPGMKQAALDKIKAIPTFANSPVYLAAFDRAWATFEKLPADKMTDTVLDFLNTQEQSKVAVELAADINRVAMEIATSKSGNPKPFGNGNGSGSGNGNGTGDGAAPAVRLNAEERMAYEQIKQMRMERFKEEYSPAQYKADVAARAGR